MFKKIITLSALLMASQWALASSDFVKYKSSFSVESTVKRLESILNGSGIPILANINHQRDLTMKGHRVLPSQVIVFSEPRMAAALISCSPAFGIELPQKMVVWQDNNKDVWVSYKRPELIAEASHCSSTGTDRLNKLLKQIAFKATGK